MGKLRIAAFQRWPQFDNIPRILERLRRDLEWCDGQSVDLALFPECYLQGYVLDRASLGAVAMAIEDDRFQSLLADLAPSRSTFVLGLVERHGESLLNSAAAICRGAVIGAYRKTHLHRKEQAFDAGHDYPIFQAANWKFGINICCDANFPEAAAAVERQGARLICYLINNMLPPDVADRWRHRSVDNLRRRAIETGCWVMSSDVVGTHDAMLSYGCTCIVNPVGDVVARVDEGNEGVALFDCE